jgi:prepilin signal peptidase PulO-like enzyme (type II secretory pathway)
MHDLTWGRASAEIFPLAAWVLGARVCCRVPLILEIGWRALFIRMWRERGAPRRKFIGRPGSALGVPQAPLRLSEFVSDHPWRGRAFPFALAGAAVGVLTLSPVGTRPLFGLGLFISGLAILAQTDGEHGIVPDFVLVPLLASGFVAAALGLSALSLEGAAAGLAAGWASGKVVQWLLCRLAGSTAEFGDGDVKVLSLVGVWLGGPPAYGVLVLATMAYSVTGRGRPSPVAAAACLRTPFVPHLFVATAGMTPLWIIVNP